MGTVSEAGVSSELARPEAIAERLAELEKRVAGLEERTAEDRVTMGSSGI
jgi:hypothetical protein